MSARMEISMRQDELEGLKLCDSELNLYIESTPESLREWLKEAVKGTTAQNEDYEPEENLVLKISSNIRSAWEKTMRIDRHVNQKLAGEDSFYNEQKDKE